jgi:hypothetical protein
MQTGTELIITSGDFAGKTVKVSQTYESPVNGLQVVLQVQIDGRWVDFVRESATVVQSMSVPRYDWRGLTYDSYVQCCKSKGKTPETAGVAAAKSVRRAGKIDWELASCL